LYDGMYGLQPRFNRLTQFPDIMKQLDLKQVRAINSLFKCILSNFIWKVPRRP
jgi:hypothetical protein